jgi:hypothetical protein
MPVIKENPGAMENEIDFSSYSARLLRGDVGDAP